MLRALYCSTVHFDVAARAAEKPLRRTRSTWFATVSSVLAIASREA